MQSKKRSFADVDPERPKPTSNHDEASSRAQLSANMARRLEKLAPWRIDPSLLKISKPGPDFEGGCAVVSQALLYSSSYDAKDQLSGTKTGNLMTSNPASKPEGVNECREQEASGDEGRSQTEGENGGQEHKDNAETHEGRKPVAVKKMKVKTRSDVVKVLGLTIREAEFLVNHSHENIIKLEGFVEDVSKNIIWLIFPWEENGNLKKFIASAEWEIPERISLLHDVARGMEYLHTRNPPICHGDLKSANILVNSECRALITDFGSAHHLTTKDLVRKTKRPRIDPNPAASPEATFCPSTNTITLTHNKCTLRWAAPELLEKDDASLASDVWAFGCVVYEVMTDSIPFQDVKDANVIMRVVQGDLPSISSDARMLLIQSLCTLVRQCWSIDPTQRPTAEGCRGAIDWMPMIVPNPVRTADAAGLSGRSAGLLMQLGHMHKRQNDYSNASKYFVEALSLYAHIEDRHGRASALMGLAEVHLLRNEYNRAVTFYSECLQIRTDIGDRHGRASAHLGLAEVHRLRNEYNRAVTFYSECLQIRTDIGDRHGRAEVLWGLAEVHRLRNEYNRAVTFYSECLQIRTDIGDRHGRADALFGLAEVHRLRNEYNQTVTFYSECLQIRTDIGDRYGRASALWGLADVHRLRNEYNQAVTFYSECLQIRTDIGDRHGRADALFGLADVHRLRNEYNQAVTFYSECLQIQTDIGDRYGRASALWGLADVHRLRNEYNQAVTFYSECLQIRTDIGDRHGRAEALWGLANVHRARNEYSQALKLFSEALQISVDIGSTHWKAFILFDVANTHHDQAHYSGALDHYEQAAEAFQQLGYTHNAADAGKRASDVRQLLVRKGAA